MTRRRGRPAPVVDQRWLKTSNGTATDRFQYGHDSDGNVMYENNLLYPALGALYGRNSADPGDDNNMFGMLGQLPGFQRGTLSASGHIGSAMDTIASPNETIDYDLDTLGSAPGGGRGPPVRAPAALGGATRPGFVGTLPPGGHCARSITFRRHRVRYADDEGRRAIDVGGVEGGQAARELLSRAGRREDWHGQDEV